MDYLLEEIGYKRNPIIFSDKDIYVNFDKWKSGEIKSLLIVGLSGSGKSTLGRKLAEEYNGYYVEIDVISFKIGILHPERANWQYIKENDKYLYQYFKENNIPPDIMLQFKDYQDIEKSKYIDSYIHWLCFERPDLDKNPIVIEGGDVAITLTHDEDLSEMPIVFKGTSLATSMLRRFFRAANKKGYLSSLNSVIKYFAVQYAKMYPEVNDARNTVLTKKEYEELDESWRLHLWR